MEELDYIYEILPREPFTKFIAEVRIVREDGWCKYTVLIDEQKSFNCKDDAIDYLKSCINKTTGYVTNARVKGIYDTLCGSDWDIVKDYGRGTTYKFFEN